MTVEREGVVAASEATAEAPSSAPRLASAVEWNPSGSTEGSRLESPPSPLRGSALKAVRILSPLLKLYAEKQQEAEGAMEEFGTAVSTQASEAELQRLSGRLEKVQADVERLGELKASVETKQAEADAALADFGRAVETMAPEEEKARLSLRVEDAKRALEHEESARLAEFNSSNEIARNLERMRLKAAKAEETMRAAAAKKPVVNCPRLSLEQRPARRPSLEQPGRRASAERRSSRDQPSRRSSRDQAQRRHSLGTRKTNSDPRSNRTRPVIAKSHHSDSALTTPQPPAEAPQPHPGCAARDHIRKTAVAQA